LLQACQFARSKPDTAAAAATKYCGTAEGLEKVLDFPVPSSSSNAHAFRPRDAEQRSPDKPQRIMAHASQLLAAVQQQQQQQQAGNIAADQVSPVVLGCRGCPAATDDVRGRAYMGDVLCFSMASWRSAWLIKPRI
jgi:hypothetical protein